MSDCCYVSNRGKIHFITYLLQKNEKLYFAIGMIQKLLKYQSNILHTLTIFLNFKVLWFLNSPLFVDSLMHIPFLPKNIMILSHIYDYQVTIFKLSFYLKLTCLFKCYG